MQGFFRSIGNTYSKVAEAGSYLQSPLLLLVRLYWGYQFFLAGIGKYANLTATADFFSSINIPFPAFNAYLVATVETFGGLLLIIGLASRLAALPLVITMIAAYFTAHYKSIEQLIALNPVPFMQESPFLFLYASLVVLAFGPGLFSVDGLVRRFSKGGKA